jgi:hypothetical protein
VPRRLRVPNYPGQARDAAGRWTESGAVKASRIATSHSSHLIAEGVSGGAPHRHAGRAHAEAAAAHREMAERHAALGNKRASQKFASLAEEHEGMADYHAERAGPPADRVPFGKRPDAKRSLAALRGHETRGEREEAARVNIRADYLPLWEETKA